MKKKKKKKKKTKRPEGLFLASDQARGPSVPPILQDNTY
jgi:hypothetical protein